MKENETEQGKEHNFRTCQGVAGLACLQVAKVGNEFRSAACSNLEMLYYNS
jgi:hypothetical protein